MMRTSLLAILTALSVAACTKDPETAEAPPGPPPPSDPAAPDSVAGPQAVEGQIDWAAARDAKSKQQITDTTITVQQMDANAGPPKVPVLLPSGIAQAQNARPPALVHTRDGYFATYHLPQYDAIVNGSQKSYQAGAAAAGGDKEAMKFTTGEGSAQLAFSRFGADYLIEFECREVDGANSCITEDQAKEFAESLFVQQTQ